MSSDTDTVTKDGVNLGRVPGWIVAIHVALVSGAVTWGLSMESRLARVEATQDAILRKLVEIDSSLTQIESRIFGASLHTPRASIPAMSSDGA